MVQRFVWLDAMRGIASIMVLIFHYHHFYLTDFSSRALIPSTELFPYVNFLLFIYENGKYAVQLFWVISGFVFYHIYLNKKASLRQFVVHRFARLYPLHFMTLLIVAMLQFINIKFNGYWQIYGSNDLYHFVLQLFFASNFLTVNHGLSFNGPIWSVSLEMFAYFLFFIVLPLLRKNTIVLTLVLLAVFINFDQDLWKLSGAVFYCASYFFLGGLVYWCFRMTRNSLTISVSVVLLLLIVSIISILSEIKPIKIMAPSALLVYLTAILDNRYPVKVNFLEKLGNSSYSLYLVHVPIQILVLTIADVFLLETEVSQTPYLRYQFILFFACLLRTTPTFFMKSLRGNGYEVNCFKYIFAPEHFY